MAEIAVAVPLVRVGLKDTYSHGATLQYLMKEHDLNAISLVRRIETLLHTSFSLTEADLIGVRSNTGATTSTDQLEAL